MPLAVARMGNLLRDPASFTNGKCTALHWGCRQRAAVHSKMLAKWVGRH